LPPASCTTTRIRSSGTPGRELVCRPSVGSSIANTVWLRNVGTVAPAHSSDAPLRRNSRRVDINRSLMLALRGRPLVGR
jgi:hypothetical protein